MIRLPMGSSAFKFQPIVVNANAPKGACILRTFDDIGEFIFTNVDHPRGLTPLDRRVPRDLLQARYGARRDEVHEAMRNGRGLAGLAVRQRRGASVPRSRTKTGLSISQRVY
jgi:hypothetical protein